MSTAIATTKPSAPSALAVMAGKMNVDPAKLLSTLKATVFSKATDEELLALVVVANEYGLNPILKELFAFPAKGGGIVPVVSVDGWIRMANDHPQMDGVDFLFEETASGELISCTATIWRKDRAHPTRVTEYLAECKRNTEPWKMERRMLRHKALIQCARVAFGFSGIMDEDEAAKITVSVEPAASVAAQVTAGPKREPRVIEAAQPEATPAPTEPSDNDGGPL